MTTMASSGLPLLVAACAAAMLYGVPQAVSQEKARFEVAAWVDHFDFAGIRREGKYLFDTETVEGCAAILDHVQEVGATTILWRNCGGATMRYQSAVEAHHHESKLDKRRVPDTRPIYGWVRYGEAQPDILRSALRICRERGLRPGVHWPYEETHWSGWTIGGWNLEHPQYWGRTVDGHAWWGRCSLGWEEVVRHKLALVTELVDRGIEVLFIDFYRTGGWSPAYEYVEPVARSYREAHGEEPPVDPQDLRWCRHVAGYVTGYLRRVRETLDASGRKIDLYVGIPEIAPVGDPMGVRSIVAHGADWPTWIDQGLIDGLVINSVRWDAEDPMGSTRNLCRQVMKLVHGRCRVLWPVRQYDFSGFGIPSYRKATKLPDEEIARRLVEMAWEEGADGISLECVDYGNYREKTREVIRTLTTGKCKFVRTEAVP